MNRLFLFNPENDIALAKGGLPATPPRQAAMLHRAGAMLPYWLGNNGDRILVAPGDFENSMIFKDSIENELGILGPTPIGSVSRDNSYHLTPWGWSLDAIKQYERAGAVAAIGNDEIERIQSYRDISHRRTALEFMRKWGETVGDTAFTLPIEARYVTQIMEYMRAVGEVIVKSPWSSSGRGVFPVSARNIEAVRPLIEGIIHRQGSIMVEPYLPKVQDFAMLFNYRKGRAEYVGMSLFFNSTATNYGGNLVGSDQMIIDRLSCMIPSETIEGLKNDVTEILQSVLRDSYEGPLGVDMMIWRDGAEGYRIDPCVEINLRYTMGFVAQGIWRKIGRKGVMAIAPKGSVNIKTGDKPIRLVPDNEWFDMVFMQTDTL